MCVYAPLHMDCTCARAFALLVLVLVLELEKTPLLGFAAVSDTSAVLLGRVCRVFVVACVSGLLYAEFCCILLVPML